MKNKEFTSREWFRISNESDESITIDIDGYIGWDEKASWDDVKKKLIDVATKAQKKLIVNIHSLGGFIDDGLMIHDALRMTKAKVTTRAYSMIASAATVIAQAGDVRQMSSNALYLIHKASMIAWGNSNQIAVVLQDLNTIDERIMELYAKRSKVDKKAIQDLMEENNGTGKWIDAEEALKYGLIDEILEPSKAVAMIDSETIKKYNLPQIPKEMMEKIQSENEISEPKKGILKKIIDFFGSLGIKVENDEPDPQPIADNPVIETPVAETANADPAPITDSIPEIPLVESPIAEPEKIENNIEVDILKIENVRLLKEVDDLKASLSEAQQKLAQAGAQSTKPGGIIGREDPDLAVSEDQKSWNEDAEKLVDMLTLRKLKNKSNSKIPKE
jgi:ATP-dependent protease ClpP protease subunit